MNQVRLIASYLPQFYPTKENDEWWHKGFTEWTNVGKAKPLFKGHYQPRVPKDLGYYDLRLPEVREQQADMARAYGIEGFCYWHYWFGNGDRVLTRVFDEVVKSGKPDFPFCLAWANETWSGRWHGANDRILKEQTYPGTQDYINHFNELLPAFKDKRYIRVNGKLFFMIYQPSQLPNAHQFINLWQDLANKNGLEGFYFVAHIIGIKEYQKQISLGFDAVNVIRYHLYETRMQFELKIRLKRLRVYEYKDALKVFVGDEEKNINCIPTIMPNWDHSPRSGKSAYILHNSTPEYFEEHLKHVFNIIKDKPLENRIAMIKSWNEWGEGNYLEPDLVHGYEYLEAIKRQLDKF